MRTIIPDIRKRAQFPAKQMLIDLKWTLWRIIWISPDEDTFVKEVVMFIKENKGNKHPHCIVCGTKCPEVIFMVMRKAAEE